MDNLNYRRERDWRPIIQDSPPSRGDRFLCRLNEAWVLYYPVTDRLLILNATAKTVWDFLCEGRDPCEIAGIFARTFGISEEEAARDVAHVLTDLTGDNPQAAQCGDPEVWALDPRTSANADHQHLAECGVYRFGRSTIRILSAIAELDESFFSRFQQRAMGDCHDVQQLLIGRDGTVFRLTFDGIVVAEAKTIAQTVTLLVEFLFAMEHPHENLLAICHAGAVSRGGRSVLMAGSSGVGKSTLTGFLAAHGFAYLGDDGIAISDDLSLLPLPTCLSIKAGSWAVLEPLYPALPTLATINRYGRSIRYVTPQQGNYEPVQVATTPTAIVFPAYTEGMESTRLTPLQPLQAMIHLLGAHARLSGPVTEVKLAKFVRFVEQTPAYELSYSELSGAMKAIETLLDSQA